MRGTAKDGIACNQTLRGADGGEEGVWSERGVKRGYIRGRGDLNVSFPRPLGTVTTAK